MRWVRTAALAVAIVAGIAACYRVVDLSAAAPDATPADLDAGLFGSSDALSDGELPPDGQAPGDAR